jgi:hypothetical protein
MGEDPNQRGVSRRWIVREVEDSLNDSTPWCLRDRQHDVLAMPTKESLSRLCRA